MKFKPKKGSDPIYAGSNLCEDGTYLPPSPSPTPPERMYTAGDIRRVAMRALWLSLREVERMKNETDEHPGIVKMAMTDLGIFSSSPPESVSGEEQRPVHSTTWEDAQMAGVECDGQNVGTIAAYDRDEPWICSRCGAVLRLVWGVRLEEVRDVR